MNILAIHYGFNASIAYTEQGELRFLLHEEKFDNIKNSMWYPTACITYLKTQIDINKIDKIIINPKNFSLAWWKKSEVKAAPNQWASALKKYTWRDYLFFHLYQRFPRVFNRYNDARTESKSAYQRNRAWFAQELTSKLGREITIDMIDIAEHHITHALSTIYFYGLHQQDEPILLLSLDGAGDRYCSSVRIREKWSFRDLGVTRFTHSLGFLWSYVTWALGMKPHEHEYKVMGLAAYSSPTYYQQVYDKLFKWLIWIDGYTFKSRIPLNLANVYLYDKLYWLRFDNIAGALQAFTEDIVLERITHAVEMSGIKKIALSGWVFMNVKLNQKIQELTQLDKVYFMPSAGDESTVLGQVLYGYLAQPEQLAHLAPLQTMYSGIQVTREETKSYIEQHGIAITHHVLDLQTDEQSAKHIAKLLSQFEIVGVCRGKGEWWARSLCNRWILSNASDLKSFHTVNDMIKMRDFRMPFAPTMLAEYAPRYLRGRADISPRAKESAYFMITAFGGTDLAQQHLRASMHQKDKTLRPQLVDQESNAWMYDMLQTYEQLTGMWGVMNTSLNIHGYPLVGGIEQALFTFEKSGLQHLLLDTFLISKRS